MQSTFAPQTGRLDRYVRRSYLRVGEGASRHRIAYALEEALRLATLPGEEEGRIYCFRTVSLSGVPAEANRRVWMEQVQQVLGNLATQAVHGTDPNAGAANVVYFNNIEEALGTLLRKAVRAHTATQASTPDWFSNSVIGAEPGEGHTQQIPALLDRLRPPAMAPGAAAAILFAALGDADPVPLLSAIPVASIRERLRELDGQSSLSASAPPVQLPGEIKTALQRAASHFGWKDPATIWLAAQAVLCLLPGTWSSGTAVKRARATLRILEEEQLREPQDRTASIIRSAAPPLVFDDEDETAAGQRLLWGVGEANPEPRSKMELPSLRATADESPSSDRAPAPGEITVEVAPAARAIPEIPEARPLLGEATIARESDSVIVNQAFVETYLRGANPIGQGFETFGDDTKPVRRQIVGVAASIHYNRPRHDDGPTFYTPLRDNGEAIPGTTRRRNFDPTMNVRADSMSPAFITWLRQKIETTEPAIRVRNTILLASQIDNTLLSERLLALLAGFFSVVALLLAAVGLYGVINYAAVRRTREIGIRIALGARRGQVVRLIVAGASIPVVAGIALGTGAGMALARYLASQVFGVKPTDLASLAAPVACIVIAAVAASLPPAMRAANRDPLIALRHE